MENRVGLVQRDGNQTIPTNIKILGGTYNAIYF